VRVELRDVSLADRPSVVIASTDMHGVTITPGATHPFELMAPAVPGNRSLALRVEVTTEHNPSATGYLTTTSIPVAAAGDAGGLEAALTKIAG
jgi:putative lipoprotein